MPQALPKFEFAFPGPLRDRLIEAIESGVKTATSSLAHEYEVVNEPLPEVGDSGVVVDSSGRRLFVIETVDVRVVPLRDVPVAHAIVEGEGHGSVEEWCIGHLAFGTQPNCERSWGRAL
ncbi:MAG: ASCH domain-containing protein [Nakamurella sp.]